MKKWILSTICIVVFSGFAAAQKSSEPQKKGKEDTRKGTIVKKGTESVNTGKTEDAPVKLAIATPVINTVDAPKIKQR